VEEEPDTSNLVDGGLEAEQQQISWCKRREALLPSGTPKIDLIHPRLICEEFKPLKISGIDVELQNRLAKLRNLEPLESFSEIVAFRLETRVMGYNEQTSVHFL
jgi:hypothetical protein